METQYSNAVKGISRDDNDLQRDMSYRYALNATVESHNEEASFPFLSNTTSNFLCYQLSDNEKFIGICKIPELNGNIYATYDEISNKQRFILIEYNDVKLHNKLSYKECEELVELDLNIKKDYNLCSYKILLEVNCFEWSMNNPVYFNYKWTDCNLNLYFNNGLDEDRYIYFNHENGKSFKIEDDFRINNGTDCEPSYTDIDCNKTLFNPIVLFPCIKTLEIAGEKSKGMYSYLIAYCNASGQLLTSFNNVTMGHAISKDKKGIALDIIHNYKDSKFKYFMIVAAETINGTTTYKQKGILSTSQTKFIDTDNDGTGISIQKIFAKYPYYKNSRFIQSANNIFFRSGVKEYEKYNLQKYFNNVEVEWVAGVLKEGDYKDSSISQEYKSWMRDEVVAIGVELIASNAEPLPVFHIPGRKAIESDKVSYELNTRNCNESIKEYWQVFNTATRDSTYGTANSLYNGCKEINIIASGSTGFYESVLAYPNNKNVYGDLCGEKIRHHRLPDHNLIPHFSNEVASDGLHYIYPIGIRLKTDIQLLLTQAVTDNVITQEQKDRIIGYKVLRGNRANEKSIIAKGLFYDVWSYERDYNSDVNFYPINAADNCDTNEDKIFFPNFPFNDLRPNEFLSNDRLHYKGRQLNSTSLPYINTNRYTFHSPETHFTEPNLGGYVKIEGECYGVAKAKYNPSLDFSRQTLLGDKQYDIARVYATFLSSMISSPTESDVAAVASNLGGKAGAAVGGLISTAATAATGGAAAPAAGLIQSVTSGAGALIGSLIGSNVAKNSLSSLVFKQTLRVSQTESILTLLKSISSSKQLHYQYVGVGDYKSFIPKKDFVTETLVSEYIQEGKLSIQEDNGSIKFNNKFRESSVFIKTKDKLPNHDVVDNSRALLSSTTMTTNIPLITNITTNCNSYKISLNESRIRQYYREVLRDRIEDSLGADDVGRIGKILIDLISSIASDGAFGVIGSFFLAKKADDQFNLQVEYTDCLTGEKNYESLDDRTSLTVCSSTPILDIIFTLDGEEYKFTNIENEGSCDETIIEDINRPCKCNTDFNKNISSFYGSLKRTNLSQYGTVFDIDYIDTSSCHTLFSNVNYKNKSYFGGDTFIGRMSLKRKHSFFNSFLHKNPDEILHNYSLYPNVANPVYFFDTNPVVVPKNINLLSGLTFPLTYSFPFNLSPTFKAFKRLIVGNLISNNKILKPNYKFDCYDKSMDIGTESDRKLRLDGISGIMYTFMYGIIYYIVESEVNLDLRDSTNNLEKNFYPKEQDADNWTQESTVPIINDNFYEYDKSYSKQPKHLFNYKYDINFDGTKDCKIDKQERIIYSQQGENIEDSDYKDPYLVNKGLDYYDFPIADGRIVAINPMESEKVLVRLENTSYVFGAYYELNTNEDTALLSVGSIFNRKPMQFSKTALGYFGTQHTAFIDSQFGNISVDAKRGHVFKLGNNAGGLEEISNKGLRNWFKENLPFAILDKVKNANIDNTWNGIGIALGYDNRFNLFYLTKLDYECLSDDVRYDTVKGKYYLASTLFYIELSNKKYFRNKSWTISFNFYTNSWISWHSILPVAYVENIANFDSIYQGGIWRHNLTNASYQTFYGKQYPFIVEVVAKAEMQNSVLTSVKYWLDLVKYYNDTDYYHNQELSFNKAIIHNRFQSSGLLNLTILPYSTASINYPIKRDDSRDIELVLKEKYHRFNQFENIVKKDFSHLPIWLHDGNNLNNILNIENHEYRRKNINNDLFRYDNTKIRLINDKLFTYKFIFKGLLNTIKNVGIR